MVTEHRKRAPPEVRGWSSSSSSSSSPWRLFLAPDCASHAPTPPLALPGLPVLTPFSRSLSHTHTLAGCGGVPVCGGGRARGPGQPAGAALAAAQVGASLTAARLVPAATPRRLLSPIHTRLLLPDACLRLKGGFPLSPAAPALLLSCSQVATRLEQALKASKSAEATKVCVCGVVCVRWGGGGALRHAWRTEAMGEGEQSSQGGRGQRPEWAACALG